MHSTIIFTVLSAAALVTSAPLEARTPAKLLGRANPSPVSCGPDNDQRAWPLQSVQDAFNALVANGNKPNNDKPKAGTRPYPQQYGSNSGIPSDAEVTTALDAIPECKTGQSGYKYFEFPLTDPVFAGSDQGGQGPDRVIAIAQNPGQGGTRVFTYCLAITHRGGTSPTDPSFRPCAGV